MTGWRSFPRGLAFAAVAALGWLPWFLVAGPVLGLAAARAAYLVVVTALYLAGLSPRSTRGVACALATFAAGIGVVFLARSTDEVVLGLAAVIGIVRGAFLYRTEPAWAVVREVCLLGGGLVFARFLAAFAPPATAFALWGFFLVQSFLFLAAADRPRRGEARQVDPFEEAYRRATALLERTGV